MASASPTIGTAKHDVKDNMTNGILLRGTRSRRLLGAGLMACALFAVLRTSAAAQQPPTDERNIFRLVTFETAGDLRLGATQGNGEADIVDIHNAIAALTAINAADVRNLPF